MLKSRLIKLAFSASLYVLFHIVSIVGKIKCFLLYSLVENGKVYSKSDNLNLLVRSILLGVLLLVNLVILLKSPHLINSFYITYFKLYYFSFSFFIRS